MKFLPKYLIFRKEKLLHKLLQSNSSPKNQKDLSIKNNIYLD